MHIYPFRTIAVVAMQAVTLLCSSQAVVEQLRELRATGQVDPLAEMAERILLDLPEGPDTVRYEVESALAFALDRKDDPIGALEHAQNALLVARELGDTVRILGSLYQLTKLNVGARHYDEADRFRREHFSLAQAYARDPVQLALAHNSMGSMYSRLEMPDSEEFHYRAGLAALGDRNHLVQLAMLGNLASALSAKGEHEEAAQMHAQVLAELDSSDLHDRAWTLSNLGRSMLYAERYVDALAAFDLGDSLNVRSGNALDLAIDFAELRAECFEAMGDLSGAYAMIQRARDLQDTLFERSMNEQLLELETRFGTRLKEEEIQRLDAQAKAQQERLRLRNVQLYGSLVLALLGIGGVVLVWRNLRQKRRHAAILEDLNTELRGRKERVEEINRLLQLKVIRTQLNPHFIYNSLQAIGNLVRQGDTPAAAAYLDGFARLLRMVLDHSVKDQVPLSEELAFLRQYLKLESLRFDDKLNYTVDAVRELLDEDPPVPSLLVQPFVENAIWHGLANSSKEKRLTVRFAEENGRITCIVEDNGVGRGGAPARVHPDGSASMGVQLTNDRLQLLTYKLGGSGRVEFTDLQEHGRPTGTRVRVVLVGS